VVNPSEQHCAATSSSVMKLKVPCKYHPFVLRVRVRPTKPTTLAVWVYDASRRHSWYIRRRIPLEWQVLHGESKSFSLPFPQSPAELTLELFDRVSGADVGFEVEELRVEPLENVGLWAHRDQHAFVAFAQDFAAQCGAAAPGFYDAPNHRFLIEYLPEIVDRFGRPLRTPARINRTTGRIQVSAKHFRSYTIPVRLFILLHERFHRVLNTRDEQPPDREALRTYLELGYPALEALYATTKVFLEHPGPIGAEPRDRVVAIHHAIQQFKHPAA